MANPKVHQNIVRLDQILTSVSLTINMSEGGDYGWWGRGASSCRSISVMQINLLTHSHDGAMCLLKILSETGTLHIGLPYFLSAEMGRVDAIAQAHTLT